MNTQGFYAPGEGIIYQGTARERYALPHRVSRETLYALLECQRAGDLARFLEILSLCAERPAGEE